MTESRTSADFFERMYRENADPWNFEKSGYEQSRYDAIIAALPRTHYARAFEPGCSIGELTARLSQRCGHVDAVDISQTAVMHALNRCAAFSNVDIRVGSLPHHMPDGPFDLIVFSEIGYYFDEISLQGLGNLLVSRLLRKGTLLAAHWLGTSSDHILSGEHVHTMLDDLAGLQREHSEFHAGFRLDRWIRV